MELYQTTSSISGLEKLFSSSAACSDIQLFLGNSINSHSDDENEYKYLKEAESKDDNNN